MVRNNGYLFKSMTVPDATVARMIDSCPRTIHRQVTQTTVSTEEFTNTSTVEERAGTGGRDNANDGTKNTHR